MDYDVLMDIAVGIHDKKKIDYASPGNDFENFQRASLVASWFKNDDDKVYATMLTIKLARLATLLNSTEQPQNESITDSFIDLVNYAALWGSFRS